MQKTPPLTLTAIPDPSCARHLTGSNDAATLASRGVPLGLALQQTAIVSVPALKKLIGGTVRDNGPELQRPVDELDAGLDPMRGIRADEYASLVELALEARFERDLDRDA